MLTYVLICISLALVGVAGMQFAYMFWLDRMDGYRKQHVRRLERHCRRLENELAEARTKIHQQELLFVAPESEHEDGDDTWADVIDER